MERLTDRRTAEAVHENIEKLRAAGVEPSVSDVRYVRLAEYEDKDKRGEWVWDSSPEFGNPYGSYACSECKERQAFKENYCPNCGIRMKQEE
jgi:hypothetical protein